MAIHLPMNPKIGKTFPLFCRAKPKSYKLKTISCRANTNLAMQRGNTNFYEVLSLASENVGFDEIKRAYKALALRYHPDVCPPSKREESTVLFVELRKAYETLSDPVLRRIHDFELGLVDNLGFSGVGRVCLGEKRSSFPKEVWERQLCGLKKRSHDRMERKRD